MTIDALSPALAHVELAVATLALGAAGVRAASTLAPRGLERLLVAVPIAASAACLEALALGLVDLGGSPTALTLGALGSLAIALLTLPSPVVALGAECRAWYARRTTPQLALLGAFAGVLAAGTAWMLKYPFLGQDAVQYRLPAVVSWIQDGSPGSLFAANEDYATAAYPLGNELILAWPMAIARSFVPASISTPLALLLAALAGWQGLRALAVPRLPAGLAVMAVCVVPLHVRHLNEPSSDTAALAWTVCAAALCAGAGRRPALLAPALLAGALAVGTKTTVAVPVACALAAGAWAARGSPRAPRMLLLGAAAAAAVVGGLWYTRNLLLHGSPLWPFHSVPWGDPSPPLLAALDHSLLERPRATLDGHVDTYARELGGAAVLIVAALAAPLLDRRRTVLAASGVAALALVAYAAAPVTGIGDAGLPAFPALSLRYLLPALGACALAIALAARPSRSSQRLVAAVLACSIAWSLVEDANLGFPLVPSARALALGAAIGAVAAVALSRILVLAGQRAARPSATGSRVVGVGCAILGGFALSLPASGYILRHARLEAAPLVSIPRFFTGPGAPPETTPVWLSPTPDARIAGDRLRRRVGVLPKDGSCASFRRRGWVVLTVSSAALNRVSKVQLRPGPLERCAFSDRPVARQPGLVAVYPPRAGVRAAEVPASAREHP